jgi:hypothetical protein
MRSTHMPPLLLAKAAIHLVTPGFFETLGLDLIAGRDFTENELYWDEYAPSVIVSESVVKRCWPGQNPIGKRIKGGGINSDSPWTRIVGVVRESRYRALPQNPTADPDLYLPAQADWHHFALMLRTSVAPESLVGTVRREIRAIEPAAVLFNVETMEERVQAQRAQPRFVSWLMGVFAGLALLLAAIGVYGVMAQTIVQRTPEIGIRMTLGTARHDIMRLMLGRSARLLVAGVVVGAFGALLAGRLLETLLFGVTAMDPLTFVFVPILLALVALIAAWGRCTAPHASIRSPRCDTSSSSE